jgi:hypothetical protein
MRLMTERASTITTVGASKTASGFFGALEQRVSADALVSADHVGEKSGCATTSRRTSLLPQGGDPSGGINSFAPADSLYTDGEILDYLTERARLEGIVNQVRGAGAYGAIYANELRGELARLDRKFECLHGCGLDPINWELWVLGGGGAARGVLGVLSAGGRAATAREIGILRAALRGKGNFGLGSGTPAEAERLGRAWVGDGYKIASDGKTLVSSDGLRQFRPPSYKPNLSIEQANFERRLVPEGQWFGNGHLDILP